MEFYCVEFYSAKSQVSMRKFFKDLQRAKDFLWSEYITYTDDSKTLVDWHRHELEVSNYISSVGVILTYSFEDE